MQTNPAVEQNKNVKWSESPWQFVFPTSSFYFILKSFSRILSHFVNRRLPFVNDWLLCASGNFLSSD